MSTGNRLLSEGERLRGSDERAITAAEATMSRQERGRSSTERVLSTQETTMSSNETALSNDESTTSSNESTMSSAESAKSKGKRPTPAEQDEALANFISQSRVTLETILATPEILALLAPRGYDSAKLHVGLGLQSAAQSAFTARQTAIGDDTKANQAVASARTAARSAYYDFRETVRAAYRGLAERQALGVVGTIPADTEKLLTLARSGYAAAGQPPYSAVLSGLGYNDAGRSAAMATLDTLQSARATQEAARTAAIAATTARNDAAKALREWMQALHRITKVALRTRPDLLGRL